MVRSSSYSKIIQISRHKRDLQDSDQINSFSAGPSDSEGEEYRKRRLQMTSSMKSRGHVTKNDSLEVPGSSPGKDLLSKKVGKGSFQPWWLSG